MARLDAKEGDASTKSRRGQERRAKGRAFPGLRAVSRAAEWWEHKLVPILAMFYATTLINGSGPASLWHAAVVLLLALAPGAFYVSVLNDLTDRRDDAAAGKPNRMTEASPLLAAVLLAAPLAVGGLFLWLWRGSLPLQLAYLCAWIVFTLYSAPPVRLKTRGLAGVVADAAGSNLFPLLVAVGLVWKARSQETNLGWAAAVGGWGMAYGVRGILWHQLSDRQNDAAASVRTFAVRHSSATVVWLGRAAAAIELVALSIIFWRLGGWPPVTGLLLCALFAAMKFAYWRIRPTLAEPGPERQIAGSDFYDVVLPLTLLAMASARDPRNLIVLAAHLLIFPGRWRAVAGELSALAAVVRRDVSGRSVRDQRPIRAAYERMRARYRAKASRP